MTPMGRHAPTVQKAPSCAIFCCLDVTRDALRNRFVALFVRFTRVCVCVCLCTLWHQCFLLLSCLDCSLA